MKKKILIADDEPDLVTMLQLRLEANGYEVITAFDGEQALNKSHNENPDLILLDVMMPKMSGYKVCDFLKLDRNYNKIPIIIITARAQQTDESLGYEVGADAYIVKPFNTNELLSKIKELLGEK